MCLAFIFQYKFNLNTSIFVKQKRDNNYKEIIFIRRSINPQHCKDSLRIDYYDKLQTTTSYYPTLD